MHIVELNRSTAKKQHGLRVCPVCDTQTGQRIQRPKLIKRLLFWLPVKRYRCKICSSKFMVFNA